MSKKLMRTTEIYRADTEGEAQSIISEAMTQGGEVTKKIIEVKQRKSKGQIVDEAFKVTVQIDWSFDFWETGDEE